MELTCQCRVIPPFARSPLADTIGLDDEGAGVEEIVQGTFRTDKEGMDGFTASSEMIFFKGA